MATHSRTLAREIYGQRGLVGYSPRGHKESDTTEGLASISSVINHRHRAVCCIRAAPSFSLREGQQCADAMFVRILGASPGHLEKPLLRFPVSCLTSLLLRGRSQFRSELRQFWPPTSQPQ